MQITKGDCPLEKLLPKLTGFLQKVEKFVNPVLMTREKHQRRYKELGIPFDWNVLTKLKHAISSVGASLLKQVRRSQYKPLPTSRFQEMYPMKYNDILSLNTFSRRFQRHMHYALSKNMLRYVYTKEK